MPAAHFLGLRPRLVFAQYPDDLLLAEATPFHRPSPFSGDGLYLISAEFSGCRPVHLECAIRSDTLRRLAQSNRVDLPESLLTEGYTFRDFEDFRAAVHGIRPCLCKASDFSLAGFELCHQHAAEGVRYFEVSFTLGAHGVRLGDWDMPISALLDGLQLGRERYGVESRVIVDHGRSQPEEVAMRALVAALKYRERGVIGFGLGGNEQWPPELFTRAFLAAIDGGLHSVPHASEMSGPASIRGAIVHLKASESATAFAS